MIRFHVNGTPIAQPRPRRSNKGVVYTPSKNGIKGWKKLIVLEALMNIKKTIQGPVWLSLEFHLPRPKSHFGTGRNADNIRRTAQVSHTQTPDLDNLIKAVMDALTRARVWEDDSQVMELHCSKHWARKTDSGVIIRVSESQE